MNKSSKKSTSRKSSPKTTPKTQLELVKGNSSAWARAWAKQLRTRTHARPKYIVSKTMIVRVYPRHIYAALATNSKSPLCFALREATGLPWLECIKNIPKMPKKGPFKCLVPEWNMRLCLRTRANGRNFTFIVKNPRDELKNKSLDAGDVAKLGAQMLLTRNNLHDFYFSFEDFRKARHGMNADEIVFALLWHHECVAFRFEGLPVRLRRVE